MERDAEGTEQGKTRRDDTDRQTNGKVRFRVAPGGIMRSAERRGNRVDRQKRR